MTAVICILLGVYFMLYGLIAGLIRRDLMVGRRYLGSVHTTGEDARFFGFAYIVSGLGFCACGAFRLRR